MVDAQAGPETEIVLTRGDLRLVTSPYGASLRGLSRAAGAEHHPIVTGYTGGENKVGGQGDVLIPFPGRVADGRYTFQGETYQMERNDKEAPNAIHGFLRSLVWETLGQSEHAVTYRTRFGTAAHAGYPFALSARVTYRVTMLGLRCECHVENMGDRDAPVAAGFHPYFTVGSDRIDTDTLQVPFASTLEYNANLVPTGNILPVEGTPLDFRRLRPIGGTVFNTCYLHPTRDADGLLRITLAAPTTGPKVTVLLDKGFDYVVLYSGDPLPESHRRRSLAIEPMTGGSDAFNHPEWGLSVLRPGAALDAAWEVAAE